MDWRAGLAGGGLMTKIPYSDLRRVFLLATKELSPESRKVAWNSACQRPVSAWLCYAAIADPEESPVGMPVTVSLRRLRGQLHPKEIG